MPLSYKTRVALPESTRSELITQLNIAVATAFDLASQVKQAHWNVKGPQFFSHHQLFDKLAKGLRKSVDKFAERATTLGGYALGTVRLATERSQLPEYDLGAVSTNQHITALVERYALYCRLLRESAEKSGSDLATQDLFVETLREAELDLWFLESHTNV